MLHKAQLKDKNILNKKAHRRVLTEADNPYVQKGVKSELRKVEKVPSRPKYLDVYSKLNHKEQISTIRKTNFKIHQYRANNDKCMRTQPDEVLKTHSSSIQQKTRPIESRYKVEGVAGKGTFGLVYFGRDCLTNQRIAIKKVLQDRKYKNREYQILKMLKHPNTLEMLDSFSSYQGDEEYLNIIMQYYPDNLYQSIKKKDINAMLTKVYLYQIFRALNYLAMLQIAHRDIKPQNILVDRNRHKVIICDFGSAKQLVKTQSNLAYICSRCYRAPELIFGATDYSTQIDMWSMGCVVFEMVNGHPPFFADSQIDQLIEIIKVLGTPSKNEVLEMNSNYDLKEYSKFPIIKATPWKNFIQTKDQLLIDLLTKTLQYSPKRRFTPTDCLMHDYFSELRNEMGYQEIVSKLKNMPELFDYSEEELAYMKVPVNEVVPVWYRAKKASKQTTNSTAYTKKSLILYKNL